MSRVNIIKHGPLANRPGPEVPNRLYLTTDEGARRLYLDTGSNWRLIGVSEWVDLLNKPTTFPAAAPASIDGVSNDGGDIDLVAGANVTITPNDAANTITISSSGGGGGGGGGGGTAAEISYDGGTGIASTDVEGALDELATEKQDIATNYNYIEKDFAFKGFLPAANGTTSGTLRIPVSTNSTIVGVYATIGNLPVGSGSSQTLDLLRNGASVYTTTSNRPSFTPASGSQFITATLPDTTALTGGTHYLTADLITAGSPTSGGSDVVLTVRYRT